MGGKKVSLMNAKIPMGLQHKEQGGTKDKGLG